jgi:Carboxypeptidase regulatory-like domain
MSTNAANRISLCALLAVALFVGSGFAQSNARLWGIVSDSSGAVVGGAEVVVHNQATGTEYSAKTNASGAYEMPALQVGTYKMQVRAAGMQTETITGFVLQVGETVRRDFSLTVGQTSTEVTVPAEAPVIDASTIQLGQVIDYKMTQEIPLNGRHFVDLSLLTPGTVTPPANGFLTAPLRGQGSFSFNTAGQREDTVNFMVNGINLNDIVQNQITFQPSINTVSEFTVDNSTYSAQYGRNSGAIVNIATRSGTNAFHGELFDWVRNETLDARNYFAQQRAPFKRNNFGAALGGPIEKDRAHFFLSYEALRQRQGITTNSLVLTAAQRNQVAATSDSAIKQLAALIPAANDPTGGFYVSSATAPVNLDQGTADVDVSLGTQDRLHGYLALQQDLRQEPTLQQNTLPGWGDTRHSRRQISTINEDHVFSPTLTNSVRFGYNRIHITFQPNRLLNSADFGINNGVNAAIGLAQIDVGGFALDFGGPATFPSGRGDTTVALSDTLSYLHGRHFWSVGGAAKSGELTTTTSRWTRQSFVLRTSRSLSATMPRRLPTWAPLRIGFSTRRMALLSRTISSGRPG